MRIIAVFALVFVLSIAIAPVVSIDISSSSYNILGSHMGGSRDQDVEITVVDASDIPLEHAFVLLLSGSGRSYYTYTNYAGKAHISMSLGTYDLTVDWQGMEIYNATVQVIGSTTSFFVNTSVYNLRVISLDKAGLAYSGIDVSLYHSEYLVAWGNSGGDGGVDVRVPVGTYVLRLSLNGMVLYNEEIVIDSGSDISVYLDIYPVTLRIADAMDSPLGNALVVIYDDTGAEWTTEISDSNGVINLRLPACPYKMMIFFKETFVYQGELNITGTLDVTVNVLVFRCSITAIDSLANPVGGADVYLYSSDSTLFSAGRTDGFGNIEFIVPAGNYESLVFWEGRHVAVQNMDVLNNTNTVVQCGIHYLNISVVGREGEELPYSFITVKDEDGIIMKGDRTNFRGLLTMRLPMGNYTIEVTYRGEYLMTQVDVGESRDIYLDRNMDLEIEMEGYPLRLWSTSAFTLSIGVIALAVVLFIPLIHMRRKLKRNGTDKPEDDKL